MIIIIIYKWIEVNPYALYRKLMFFVFTYIVLEKKYTTSHTMHNILIFERHLIWDNY